MTVDDRLWFASSELVFADRSKDGNAIWGAILEKAWAKVKGNYVNSNGDLMQNGLRALIGVPTYRYELKDRYTFRSIDYLFEILELADEAGFIMAVETAGAGDDSVLNHCGIAMSHAYSVLHVFSMFDRSNK